MLTSQQLHPVGNHHHSCRYRSLLPVFWNLHSPAPLEKYTIDLDKIGVTFDIPRGYGAFEITDSLHYSIGTTIRFGRELHPGHLNYVPGIDVGFWPTGHDYTSHSPNTDPVSISM